VLLDGLSKKRSRPFPTNTILAPERRIHVIHFTPIDLERVETFWSWAGTRIEVEMELVIEPFIKIGRSNPISRRADICDNDSPVGKNAPPALRFEPVFHTHLRSRRVKLRIELGDIWDGEVVGLSAVASAQQTTIRTR
jgi:hypothetical protein